MCSSVYHVIADLLLTAAILNEKAKLSICIKK